jgi:hypothetical protein
MRRSRIGAACGCPDAADVLARDTAAEVHFLVL